MIFKTKFGLGEIVLTAQKERGDRIAQDLIMEVVTIGFDRDGKAFYGCRVAGSGLIVQATESELIGDPAFDQEAGCYPPETE